jgi:hypothetical protein
MMNPSSLFTIDVCRHRFGQIAYNTPHSNDHRAAFCLLPLDAPSLELASLAVLSLIAISSIKDTICDRSPNLGDHLIRTCVREDVTEIKDAQKILNQQLHQFNYRQVHPTTQEILYLRFQKALKEKRSLLREFNIRPPFQSVKDIFCLRMDRTVDSYRRVSINNPQFKVHADPRKQVNLRIHPLNDQLSEIRFWCDGKLTDVRKVKSSDLEGVHFKSQTVDF